MFNGGGFRVQNTFVHTTNQNILLHQLMFLIYVTILKVLICCVCKIVLDGIYF